LDYNHPLYLQPGDSPGLILIQLKLTGPNNYALWSRAMKLSLRGKGKLGFVDETCVKSMYKGELAEQWEKCNAIFEERFDRSNLTRIFHLWTEIATLRQGTESLTSYYSKMKDCWDELDVLAPLPSCDCEESLPYVVHLKSQRLLQFLMGLNQSYSNLRSNLLARRPVVSVNEAYATVSQEESQRLLGVVDANKEPLTMLAGRTYQGPKPKRAGENCYKIVGYPQDFKSKKKGSQTSGFRPYANSTVAGESMKPSETQGHFFIEQQYKHIMNMLIKPTTSNDADNITSNMADTGASHHITPYKELLTTFRTLRSQNDNRVQVPTGGRVEITNIGDAVILGSYKLENVLHVPDFKFNLLSVSKITKQLCCVALFFPDFCVFQGLFNGKVLGIGKEKEGLYIL
ncbi:hypothetical protein A4A49_64047, partial [Nicotiana attenuata]